NVFQLVGRQAIDSLHLRNDLIAPALNTEAVDVVSAEQGGKIRARLAQVNTLRTKFVAVEDNFGLRLVEFYVDVGIDEHAARHGPFDQFTGEVRELLRFCRGLDHKIHGEVASARKWRRGQRKHADAGN